MAFLDSLLASKIFRYIAGLAIALGLLYMVYYKGRLVEREVWKARELKESIRRATEATKVVERGQQFKEKVRKAREANPVDDARDACLLSSSKPQDECLKDL